MKKYDNYKDSGIEWLGEIPSNWKVTKLKFIGDAIGGLTYSPNDVVENESEGKLVLRSSNIQDGKLSLKDNVYVNLDISEKLTLKKGDILICSRNGSQHLIGKNICIDERTEGNTFGAFMMIFRSKYFSFLNHFFNSPIFTSQSGLFLTATINQLTSSTLNNFYIAIPDSISEQTAIANYLDHKTTQIDTLIAKKEQFISLLQEERTAVINQAVTKGLDPKVKMKDSGIEWLGEIPEHWEVAKFNLYVSIRHGHQFMNHDFTDDGVKVVKITQLHKDGYLDLSKCSYVSSEQLENYQSILIKEKDILMCLTGGTIGKIIRVGEVNEPLLQNYRVGHFSSGKASKISDDFIFWLMSSESIVSQIFFQMRETGQPNIGMDDFGRMRITIPPLMEQEKIVKHIVNKTVEISEILIKSKQEIELLKEYKTALISEVVTGKVDVRDVILN